MSYLKQTWSDYDKNKSEELNKQNGAILNSDRMNHIEDGIAEVDKNIKVVEDSAIKIDDTSATISTVYSSFKVNQELDKKANKEDITEVELPSWVGDTKPVYTADEVGALSKDTVIPKTASDVGALPDTTIIPTIPEWVGDTKPVYTAEEVGALPKDTPIPTLPSWVGNVKPTYTADEVGALPKDTIIPTIPSWVGDTKPVYTAEEVGALPKDTVIPKTAKDIGALPDDTIIPTIPEWVGNVKPTYTADEVGALSKDTPIVSIDDNTSSDKTVYSSKKVDTELAKKANSTDIPTLPNWVGEDKPTYTADEVGALPKDTPIVSIDDNKIAVDKVYSSEKVNTELGKKANSSDIPVIPEWVGDTKPVYTAEEVGALPKDTVIPTIPSWVGNVKPIYTADEVGALSSTTVVPIVDDNKTESNIWSALKTSTELGKKANKDHLLPKVWHTVSDTGSNPASAGIPGGFIINPENGIFQKIELTRNSYLYAYDGGENKVSSLPNLDADHPLMFLQINGTSEDGIIYDSFDLWFGLNTFTTRKDGLPLMLILYFDGEETGIAISATSEYALDEMHAGGDTDSRPFALKPYQTYFDTTLNKLIVWTGTAWVDANGAEV